MGFIKEIVDNYQFTLNATLQWILDFSDLHISQVEMDLYHIQWPDLHCTVQKVFCNVVNYMYKDVYLRHGFCYTKSVGKCNHPY